MATLGRTAARRIGVFKLRHDNAVLKLHHNAITLVVEEDGVTDRSGLQAPAIHVDSSVLPLDRQANFWL